MSDHARLLELLQQWSIVTSWQYLADTCEKHRRAREEAEDLRRFRERITERFGEEAYRELRDSADDYTEMMRQTMLSAVAPANDLYALLYRLHPALLGTWGAIVTLPDDAYSPRERAE